MAFDFGKNNNQNLDDSFLSSLGYDVPDSKQKSRRNAFQNAPTTDSDYSNNNSTDLDYYNGNNTPMDNDSSFFDNFNSTSNNRPNRTRKVRNKSNYKPGTGFYDIPWKIILIVVAVIVGGVLCYVFREEITNFLSQLFAWVIIILIILALLKWLIFPRRRR